MSHLVVVLLACLWLAAAVAAGRTLLRLVGVKPRGRLEPMLLSLALGFSLASYLTFALGSAGWLTPGMAWSVFAALVGVGAPSWWRLRAMRRHDLLLLSPWALRPKNWTSWAALGLLVLLALTAGLNLVAALAPPTEWDTLAHHLAAPAYYLLQGVIDFVPYREWNQPYTAEMWNVLGLLLGSDRLPQVFQWSMGVGSAGGLYLLAAGRTSRVTSLLAGTVYYTTPYILNLSSSAKSDLAWLMFLFLSVHSLLAWRERGDTRWLWLSAILTGLALATKYQGLFWAPAVGLALVFLQGSDWRYMPLRTFTRSISFGAIAGLIALPWWLRNWLAAGDPIWPYGYQVFNSRFWTQELYDKYAAWTQGPGDSVWHYFGGLWNLTLNQSAWVFGIRFPYSPVLLAFIPGLILVWKVVPAHTRSFFATLSLLVIVYYTLWFNTYQQPRYILPAIALLIIPAAYAFWKVVGFRWSGPVAMVLLALSFLLFLGYNISYNIQFARVVLGTESRHDFLARKVSLYEDMEWVNHNLPEDARVLLYHLRPLYLQRDFMLGTRNMWPVNESTAASDYLRRLYQEGITHVFISGIIMNDEESFITQRLVSQLKASGGLESIYHNSNGIQVTSRTLEESQLVPVEILKVNYPSNLVREG